MELKRAGQGVAGSAAAYRRGNPRATSVSVATELALRWRVL
jgi:hypothetical protein